MQCFKCATPLPDGSRFCTSCGADVSGASSERTQPLAFDPELMAKLQVDVGTDFSIERELGRGGMAAVYLATELQLGRKVAIKVLPPDLMSGWMVERFKREARTASALDHPHIIPIHRVSSGGKLAWYVMKYLEGASLAEIVTREGAQTLDFTVDVVAQVADALQFSHAQGVIHRDVKPANVMLDKRGWVTVTDFGIAKAAREPSMTDSGGLIGTACYMSPEQCDGRPLTGAADQYSLSVMAYEVLSGQLPFTGASVIDIINMQRLDPPPPLAVLRPSVPQSLVAVVERGLAKSPAERFGSVKEFAEAFSAAARIRATGWTAPQADRPSAAVLPPLPPREEALERGPVGSRDQVAEAAGVRRSVESVRQAELAHHPEPLRPPPTHRSFISSKWLVGILAAGTLALAGIISVPLIREARSRLDSTPGVGSVQASEPNVEQFLRVCNSGDMEACTNLGVAYANGRDVTQSDTRAVEFLRRACDGGGLLGCANLGWSYESGLGVAQSDTLAFEAYRRACDGRVMMGCSGLGRAYDLGRGVSQSVTRAVELYQQACDGGDTPGCVSLAKLYSSGRGVPRSDTRAVALFQRACDDGNLVGCADLGLMYRNGRGVTQSDTRAVELYRRACDGGDVAGCADLGWAYEFGRGGVTQSDTRAVELYRRACDGGDMFGCSGVVSRPGNCFT